MTEKTAWPHRFDRILLLIEPRPVRWLMALVWTTWIAIILVQPEKQPLIPTGLPSGPDTLERELVFTGLHIFAFVVMTALWFWALRDHWPDSRALAAAVLICLMIGGVTEYLQSFAPDRHPSIGDFLANVTGALVVANTIRWSRMRRFI